MSAAALPFIGRGAAAIGAGLFGRRSAQKATTPSAGEQAALGSATGAATRLGALSGQLGQQSLQAFGQARRFFGNLVGGNRGQLLQATAPERGQITGFFRGAERSVRSQARGGTRDLELARLSRDRAGALSGLVPAIRTSAAGTLGNLGLGGAGTAVSGQAASGGIFSNLLGTQQRGRLGGAGISRQAGSDVGRLISDLLGQGNKGGSGERG